MSASVSRIVFATDLHLTEGDGGMDVFPTDLQEIDTLSPDLLVVGGDICLWEEGAGDHLQAQLEQAPFESICLMGNHDTDKEGTATLFDEEFTHRFGARNHHRALPGAHVIGLNTCVMQSQKQGWRNVRAEVGSADLDWLDSTLADLTPDRPLLVFVHIALATTYPERRGADQATTDVWRVINADAVLERLNRWTAPIIIFQGHLHENEHLHLDDLHLISVGSVCGSWWKGSETSRCTDHSPRGWLVVETADGHVQLDYRAARTPGWHGEIVSDAEGDLLNLFFADSAETVEVRIDGEWIALPPPTPYPVDDMFVSVHHWRLPAEVGDRVDVRTQMRGRPWVLGTITRRS
ncbi:MAG: calcineurin-like phosphoesterase C-terminal domain-containing protein [Candidatus Latescibacterota bacterium]|nr:calcineurin-like phosphoesterase C-terminal domain-containing protein [Candidatus Latescibacterota bacterium]